MILYRLCKPLLSSTVILALKSLQSLCVIHECGSLYREINSGWWQRFPGHPTLTASLGGDSKVRFWVEVTLRHSENEVFFKSFIWTRRQLGFSQEGKKCDAQCETPLQQRVAMSLWGDLCLPGPWLALSIPGYSGSSLGQGHLQALALLWLHGQILTAIYLVLAAGRASLWLLSSSLEGRKAKSWILLKTHKTNTFLKTERFLKTDTDCSKHFSLSGPVAQREAWIPFNRDWLLSILGKH